MPPDSGTQQQHEYAYDTCCVLTAEIDVSDACALCLVLLKSSTDTVFELLPSLLPPMSCVKPNPDAVFGWGFHLKNDPLFRVEADPKTISEHGSLKSYHFRVNDPKTFIFCFGYAIIRDGLTDPKLVIIQAFIFGYRFRAGLHPEKGDHFRMKCLPVSDEMPTRKRHPDWVSHMSWEATSLVTTRKQ